MLLIRIVAFVAIILKHSVQYMKFYAVENTILIKKNALV